MNKLTVAFSKRTDGAIGSELIAVSESRQFSHALMIFELEGIPVVFQASHGMVHMTPLTRFLEKNAILVEYDYYLSDKVFDKVKKQAINKLGIPYGTMQLIYIAVMKLFQIRQWPTRIYNRIKNGASQEICSELMADMIPTIDPCVDFTGIQMDFITPSTLEYKLFTQGSWKWREDGET